MASNTQFAALACKPCRRLKRKCKRELPACSLCVRLEKTCEYPTTPGASHRNDFRQEGQASGNQVTETLRSTTGDGLAISSWTTALEPKTFPKLYLLDSKAFSRNCPLSLNPGMPLPAEVKKILLSSGIKSICDNFFRTTDGWIPIISKKHIYRDLDTFEPATSSSSSLALLLLCMKLVIEVPLDGEDQSATPLYFITQQFYSKIESASQISLHLLQSLILLAVFEIGHGILPTGYLRIGHAARLGALMGFHDRINAAQLFKPSETLTLREEERRTWWAVVILDRYVHIGTSGVPLAAPEPGQGDLLPCPDQRWIEGDIGSNHPLFSYPFSSILDIGHFASTCQASHILGRVLNHRDDVTNRLDRPFHLSEAMHLHQALVALDSDLSQRCFSSDFPQLNNDNSAALVAFALCCSGRLVLYNMYGCNEPNINANQQSRLPEDTEMQQVALDGIREIILFRMPLLSQTLTIRTDLASPLICYSLYHAASECAWFIKENRTDEMINVIKTYIDLLMMIEKRWKVAGLYLRLLEHEGSL